LTKTKTSDALFTQTVDWFHNERGISESTLREFGIRCEQDGAVSFPYRDKSGNLRGRKDRYGIPPSDKPRSFSWNTDNPDVKPGLFNEDSIRGTTFLVEGETDTLRLWQELGDRRETVGVVGLPGINGWKDEYKSSFGKADKVIVILDNDEDYAVSKRVEESYRLIRNSLGRKARRLVLPNDVKDICEFFEKYNWETFKLLVNHIGNGSRYEPLDLTRPPEPAAWVVDNLFARGDLAAIIGEPGLGKSWLTMSLAVAIAEGWEDWIGNRIESGNGRVLYVDEENPKDVIFSRLQRLGLTERGIRNLRYLHYQGIRLDRDPYTFLDEVLDFEPTLVVLDSLTRLHTKDENDAGSIAGLFNESIQPLARESGALVLLVHHVNKTQSGNSFIRLRGSSDIPANLDSGVDVAAFGSILRAVLFKSRRTSTGSGFNFRIKDEGDTTRLERVEQIL
jgi:hypothetical protein